MTIKLSARLKIVVTNIYKQVRLWKAECQAVVNPSRIEMSENVTSIFLPPESVRGMTVLDRDRFKRTVTVPTCDIPTQSIRAVIDKTKLGKKYALKLPKFNFMTDLEDGDSPKEIKSYKRFHMDPRKITSVDEFKEAERSALLEAGVELSALKYEDIQLTYANWTVTEVLQAVLPEGHPSISGFTHIGHIAHLNLRSEHLPWKYFIGEVILDKNALVKTVVNKVDSIDTTFRVFKMELLAGEENYVTSVKENGCIFQFDFSKVYWNTRLCTEHERLVRLVSCGDVVYDVFAGVGPFAVPMAKTKGATVFANDLNPNSYGSLQCNIKLNKVPSIQCFNLDGREFIRTVVKTDLLKRLQQEGSDGESFNIHVVMNLPALAIEFLDAFIGLYGEVEDCLKTSELTSLPSVHCYCFNTIDNRAEEDVKQEVKGRVLGILGDSISKEMSVRFVRNVSPNKNMYCVSFKLTWTVLQQTEESSGEPVAKSRKVSF